MSGLFAVRQVLADMGIDLAACLQGTGIAPTDLDCEDREVTLAQEERLFQNILGVSGDPLIGLRLAKHYPPQRYGLFGYAMLSASTLRHAMVIASRFGDELSFTWLHVSFCVQGGEAVFSLGDRVPINPGVRKLFYDRDTMAVKVAMRELVGVEVPILHVVLPHDGQGQEERYRREFGCPMNFQPGGKSAQLSFSTEWLERRLPLRDAILSERLQMHCQRLLRSLGQSSDITSEVREIIVGQPGYFPSIEVVAKKLGVSARTLRNRLGKEGTSYQDVLDEIRRALACEYLDNTRLPLQEIARLVGFVESGNFTHAFKRWTGRTPSAFRKQQ